MAREDFRLSVVIDSLRSLQYSFQKSHSGCTLSTAFVDIQVANASLSQRSSHHFMVTKSPNHRCAISCAITEEAPWRARAEAVAGSMSSSVSRKVMAPGFSMAPASKSGIAIKSSFFQGYAMPKYDVSTGRIFAASSREKVARWRLPATVTASDASSSPTTSATRYDDMRGVGAK